MKYGVQAPIPQYTNGVRKWTAGRAGRRLTAVVIHRMDGTLDGSDYWLRNYRSGSTSTHFGVGAMGIVNRTLHRYQIRQWVDTVNTAYGWAARPTDTPTPLARSVLGADLSNYSADLNWQVIHVEVEGFAYQSWPWGLATKVKELLTAIGRAHGPLVIMAHTDCSSKPCPGMSTVPWASIGGYGGRLTIPDTTTPPPPSTTIPRADGAPVRFRSIEQQHMTLKAGKPIRDGASIRAATIATTSKPTRVRVVGYMNTGSYDPWYIYAVYRGNGDSFAYSPKIDFE